MTGLNPVKLAEEVSSKVTRVVGGVEELRYYRFRGGAWYGGIATGDVVGCNLRCKFCWSWRYSYYTDKGFFCKPIDVFKNLTSIASSRGYRLVRLSGGEPTLARRHLMELLKHLSETKFTFILETNGILIGYDESYAKELSRFNNVVVRVSFKGTNPEEFELLTGGDRSFYRYQFGALENLMHQGLKPGRDFYAAAMLSFSTEDNVRAFIRELSRVHPILAQELDVEYVILYPHVVKLLRMNKLKPLKAFSPDGIPDFMI